MKNRQLMAVSLAIVFIAVGALFAFWPAKPPALVHDQADLFSPVEQDHLEAYHRKLLEEYDIDYRVAAVATTDDIARQANELFRQLTVGATSSTGRGLLLMIDAGNDRVRLEVSDALEPIYTDAFVTYIQTQQMVPFFAANRVVDGIVATSELIFTRAREAQDGQEFMPPTDSHAAGGGAQSAALIDRGAQALPAYQSAKVDIPAGELSPSEVVDLYHRSMLNRDADFRKRIYTDASQTMMEKMVVTPAQMDNVNKAYSKCGPGAAYVLEHMAVVRYPLEMRECAPYFLLLEAGQWKLDLATMSQSLRFNHLNQWHVARDRRPPVYSFAFGDSYFDRKGYPHPFTPDQIKNLRWKVAYQTLPSGRTYLTWADDTSPMKRAGLRFGDEIQQAAGVVRPSNRDFNTIISTVATGDTLRLVVDRQGEIFSVDLVAPEKRAP